MNDQQSKSPPTVLVGQSVALSACPGYDINNNGRELYGEWIVDHINPHEIGLIPRRLDRFMCVEDQTVFVDLPLPAPHYFQIEECHVPETGRQ